MRTPYRKPGKFSQMAPDPLMTTDKLAEFKNKLARLKTSQPQAAAEVARLAELGDFSENAEYQLAKGRLRGINDGILNLERQINQAAIITPEQQTDTVQIGHAVAVENDGKEKTYRILGSSETNPQKGIISHLSPLGSALIGHKAGEEIIIKIAGEEKK